MATTLPDIPLSEIPGYAEVADIVAGRPLHQFGGVVSFLYRVLVDAPQAKQQTLEQSTQLANQTLQQTPETLQQQSQGMRR